MIYKIDYIHDGERATVYIAVPDSMASIEKIRTSFYNYLRALDVSFLILKIELADPQIVFSIMKNDYGFCFIQKEEN